MQDWPKPRKQNNNFNQKRIEKTHTREAKLNGCGRAVRKKLLDQAKTDNNLRFGGHVSFNFNVRNELSG